MSFDRALAYARSFGVRLLYAVLGKDRVLEESVRVFRNVPPDAAVMMGNWIAFGRLPFAVWRNFKPVRAPFPVDY